MKEKKSRPVSILAPIMSKSYVLSEKALPFHFDISHPVVLSRSRVTNSRFVKKKRTHGGTVTFKFDWFPLEFLFINSNSKFRFKVFQAGFFCPVVTRISVPGTPPEFFYLWLVGPIYQYKLARTKDRIAEVKTAH